MSLETGKAEFVPCEATSSEALAKPITWAIRKWEGVRPENLEKHGVEQIGCFVKTLDLGECSLCELITRIRKSPVPSAF